jgi:TonB family protein
MICWTRIVFAVAAATAPGFAQAPESSLGHLRAGETLLSQHNLQAAAIEFHKALAGDHQPPWTVVWAHIDLGRAFDATSQRDRAVAEYQSALDTGDDTFGARNYATAYLEKPPASDAPDAAPQIPREPDDLISPRVLSRVEPEYSTEAMLARLEGTVAVTVSVAEDGSIAGVHVLKSLGLGLDEAALSALKGWKFAPGSVSGKPVAMLTEIPVDFRLPSRKPGWHVTRIQFEKPDNATRPVLMSAGSFVPLQKGSDLAEEALIDTAISRIPDATITMEIDTSGVPSKLAVQSGSLPIWEDDAIRTVGHWRFQPGSIGQSPIAVPCVIELNWFAP